MGPREARPDDRIRAVSKDGQQRQSPLFPAHPKRALQQRAANSARDHCPALDKVSGRCEHKPNAWAYAQCEK